ncbi:MAG: hypothetical protein JRI68_30135 [Deltaproteobacteria bacterium]|nr:hypothetical protein [Deltaproteobacteria bacterium]
MMRTLVFLSFVFCVMLIPIAAHAGCEKDTDCKGDRTCTNGKCVSPDEPKSCEKDTDCAGDRVCTEDKCGPPGGAAPGAAKPIPCWDTDGCKTEGRCTNQGDKCVAAVPSDCAQSKVCKELDRCTSKGGECVAATGDATAEPGAAAPPPGYGHGSPPPGQPTATRTETHGILGLVIAGPILFGVAWLSTIAVVAAVSSEADRGEAIGYAAIPIFGPWVMMGSDLKTEAYTGALVASGVAQTAGVTMFVLGMAIRTEEVVPVYGDRDGLSLAIAPSPNGVMAVGTF